MSTDELFSGINLITGGAAYPRGTGSAELPFMKRFIVNASKGLVEWVGGIFENITVLGDAHHFQFIHESVRQHVVAGGLQKLKPSRQQRESELCHAPSRMVRDFSPETRRQRSPAAMEFRFRLLR